RGGNEQVGDDHGEDRVHQGQQEEDDDQKEGAGASAHHLTGERADAFRAVADRDRERPEVVHARSEDRAEHHPQQGRAPAPEHGDRGADDGGGSGHGDEMVAENDVTVGGDEVDPVGVAVGGGHIVGVQPVDAAGQIRRVVAVSQSEEGENSDQYDNGRHVAPSVAAASARL